jgi:hypothetical protein
VQQVVDLELWSLPQRAAVPLDGKAIAEQCRLATSLPEEVVLGLSFVSDEADVAALAAALVEGESRERFEAFCRQQELPDDPSHPASAAHFLAFTEGQPLAWLHFPASLAGQSMALQALRWAASQGYVVRSGQGGPALSEAEVGALWARLTGSGGQCEACAPEPGAACLPSMSLHNFGEIDANEHHRHGLPLFE